MSNQPPVRGPLTGRRPGDFILFGVTAVELALLFVLTPNFEPADWIYVCSNLLVLVLALIRAQPQAQDKSMAAGAAVIVSYTYPYAQVALLKWAPGKELSPEAGLFLVSFGACLSLASLLSLGRSFGVRPALRDLVTRGPYRLVRHPLYLAYMLEDIGYNLREWNLGTLLLMASGWLSTIYRIRAEERVLSGHPNWASYVSRTRYRLVPGVW